jgi:predicted DNA binding CopG/RHH family protein
MIKKKKNIANGTDVDAVLEHSDLADFDLSRTQFIHEPWNLEKSYPLHLRVQKGILAEAKGIAKEKGLPYQTLIKLYISDGVRRDRKLLAA